MLEIANTKEIGSKQSHIGYYLIDKGVSELYIGLKRKKKDSISEKVKQEYIFVLQLLLL